MSTSKELIAQQARQILGLLPPEDRTLVEAHIADQVAEQDLLKVRWASTAGSLTVVGSVAAVAAAIACLIYLVAWLPSGEQRCEGWCARDTKAYQYVPAGKYSPDICTCVTPTDPTRIWHP